MMHFNTIRAMSIRIGDKIPTPLVNGGWDRSKPREVYDVARNIEPGMMTFTLDDGSALNAFFMNQIPFRR
jgi:hypothetical protein